jgi:peptidoglycan-N-acetylglucosamine deacetylase
MSLSRRSACLFLALTVVLGLLTGCQPVNDKIRRHKRKLGTYVPQMTLVNRFWRNAKNEVDKSTLELLAQDKDELQRGLRRHKFFQGDHRKRWIALTFDDGPHPAFTPQILNILKNNGVKATFFLVGEMAERYPDLVRQELAAGHDLGNHSYNHINLTMIPTEEIAAEIETCGDVIESISHQRPDLFRPPGGDYNRNTDIVAEALGYTLVLWSDNAGDWASPGGRTIKLQVFDNISNGGVILMHDGVQETVDVLPRVIEVLKQRGYQFVTIDEMLPASARVSLEADYLNKL